MQSDPGHGKKIERWILHLDMDAFFASVEQLDRPELIGKPVVIGVADRGVVSTASYEARAYGIRSAMPVFQAKRLCPQAVFLHGRMDRYLEKSQEVMACLSVFSPLVEKASVDEAYLDLSGVEMIYGPVIGLAAEIQATVYRKTGLTCSVGMAPVKFLAKIASDMRKPGGLTVISPGQLADFLQDLPLQKIPGVGKSMLAKLGLLNVKTAADVQRYPKSFWVQQFGKSGEVLSDRAAGIDPRNVEPFTKPKSESAENTFAKDSADRSFLSTQLLQQSERVGRRLRAQGFAGRTVTIKLKYSDFNQKTRSRTLKEGTNLTRIIYETALSLLDEGGLEGPLRLIGVGVSHFEEGEKQLPLLPPENENLLKRESAIDVTMDTLRAKFGNSAIVRGKLFTTKKNG